MIFTRSLLLIFIFNTKQPRATPAENRLVDNLLQNGFSSISTTGCNQCQKDGSWFCSKTDIQAVIAQTSSPVNTIQTDSRPTSVYSFYGLVKINGWPSKK